MKSVWLSCTVLCLGIMAGCSSATSTADQTGDASAHTTIVDPEWAKGDQRQPDVTVAMKIQPIPDLDDDASSAGEDAPPTVKPIPDDGN